MSWAQSVSRTQDTATLDARSEPLLDVLYLALVADVRTTTHKTSQRGRSRQRSYAMRQAREWSPAEVCYVDEVRNTGKAKLQLPGNEQFLVVSCISTTHVWNTKSRRKPSTHTQTHDNTQTVPGATVSRVRRCSLLLLLFSARVQVYTGNNFASIEVPRNLILFCRSIPSVRKR